jgi:hypothetical protein
MSSQFGYRPDFTLFNPESSVSKAFVINVVTESGPIKWKLEIDKVTNNLTVLYSNDNGLSFTKKVTVRAEAAV